MRSSHSATKTAPGHSDAAAAAQIAIDANQRSADPESRHARIQSQEKEIPVRRRTVALAILAGIALGMAIASDGARGATIWINPQHPERVLDSEMQLCRAEAWSKVPTGQSESHMLVDTIFGTGYCLVQRGWVLVSYVPSQD